MNDKPVNLQLIDEYGLAEPHLKLLRLARQGPIQWPDQRLQEITRQPGGALRKLVDRKMLDGPKREQPIKAKAFTITALGQETLRKIEAGLHRPGWLSEGKVKVLALLTISKNGSLAKHELLSFGTNMQSIDSLARAGYVGGVPDFPGFYRLTDLGREALKEWRAEKEGAK